MEYTDQMNEVELILILEKYLKIEEENDDILSEIDALKYDNREKIKTGEFQGDFIFEYYPYRNINILYKKMEINNELRTELSDRILAFCHGAIFKSWVRMSNGITFRFLEDENIEVVKNIILYKAPNRRLL